MLFLNWRWYGLGANELDIPGESHTLRVGGPRDEEVVHLGRDGLRAVPFFSG